MSTRSVIKGCHRYSWTFATPSEKLHPTLDLKSAVPEIALVLPTLQTVFIDKTVRIIIIYTLRMT